MNSDMKTVDKSLLDEAAFVVRKNRILDRTFSFNSELLPTISEIREVVLTDDDHLIDSSFSKKLHNSYVIRDNYCGKSFPILTHEFICAVKTMADGLKFTEIAELGCGRGWLSHWLIKYGVPIRASIDDKSWGVNGRFGHSSYLNIVTKMNGVKYVRAHPEIQLFILSWPYMDSFAERIWRNMKLSQYLLYIGESYGGCTANDKFFSDTEHSVVDDIWGLGASFVRFYGLHDRPILFRKNEEVL